MRGHGRLPRSLQPLVGESLTGYILNLARRTATPPGDLAQRLGLLTHPNYATLNVQFGISLPRERVATMSEATGLSADQIISMTHQPHERLFVDANTRPADGWSPQQLYVEHWISPTSAAFCPRCLAAEHTQGRRRLWKRDWKTPWALACFEHGTLLSNLCPRDDLHVTGRRDPQAQSLVRAPRHHVTDPAACRHPVPKPLDDTTKQVVLCGTPLFKGHAAAAAPETLRLQQLLDAILAGQEPTTTTLGVQVSPAQYLRDLRLSAVLVQVAKDPGIVDSSPQSQMEPTLRYLEEGRTTRAGGSGRWHKTWALPIPDPTVAATVITRAAQLLATPAGDDTITELVTLAIANEPARWKKLSWQARPSDRLAPLVTQERKGIISAANLRRVAKGQRIDLDPDHVPAYLDDPTYIHLASGLPTHDERAYRRAIPIGVIRLTTGMNASEAARHLGYEPKIGNGATARLSMRLDPADERRVTHDVVTYARELAENTTPTNYAHRREYFDPDWRIANEDWLDLKTQLAGQRITNKNSVLEQRLRAYSAWVWGLATSGDPVQAPMVEPEGERRTAPGHGVVQTLRTLMLPCRAFTTLHHQLVGDLAARICQQIDDHESHNRPAPAQAPAR